MQRRGFLQCIALSSLAAVLPWRDLAGWEVSGEATAPGVRLRVSIAPHVPADATLHVEVQHTRGAATATLSRHAQQVVHGGQEVEVVTPYPYADLVAGTYAVRLHLQDACGRPLDTHDAGTYTVRRFRFSA